MQIASEQDIVDGLFNDVNVTSNKLTTENEYVLFAKSVSKLLLEGKAPYRVPAFFKEMFKDLPL